MRKLLSLLGLLALFSAPAFAACPCRTYVPTCPTYTYMPVMHIVSVPVRTYTTVYTPCPTGAACPVIRTYTPVCPTCNPHPTGYAIPAKNNPHNPHNPNNYDNNNHDDDDDDDDDNNDYY